MEQVVCKHFQTGFCKFAEHCRKQHVQEICQTNQCTLKSCTQRHPNICRYFNTHNACKFGEKCAYLHNITKEKSDTAELENKINKLEEWVQTMSQQITSLQNEISSMKKKSSSTALFKWTECGYKASTNTVLKRHITTKHNIKTLEQISDSITYDSPKLVHSSQEERDKTIINIHEAVTEHCVNLKCEYWNCQFNAKDTKDLENHIKVKHVVDESFKYPDSTEEIECPDCDFVFVADHDFARHVYEEHLYSFTCRHCQKHLPGDDYMVGIHYTMCPAPCDDHRLCPCKFWSKLVWIM